MKKVIVLVMVFVLCAGLAFAAEKVRFVASDNETDVGSEGQRREGQLGRRQRLLHRL
jgi:hypothetical protein